MSTISNSASLRFFRSSCTHFATAAAFRPGRVLPTMIPTFIICFFSFPVPYSVTDGYLLSDHVHFSGLLSGAIALHFLMADLFSRQQPELLNGPVQLFLLRLGQGRHNSLKVPCMPLEARCRQALSFRSQVNDARSSISWARLANNQA